MPPRLFYSFDVLGFHDRGAQPIWSTKQSNKVDIMRHGVLPRKREGSDYSGGLENLAICMKPSKCIFNFREGLLGDDITMDKVTELKQCPEGMHNINRDITFNCGQVNLRTISTTMFYIKKDVDYLHKCF
jgi:hypothetical protein